MSIGGGGGQQKSGEGGGGLLDCMYVQEHLLSPDEGRVVVVEGCGRSAFLVIFVHLVAVFVCTNKCGL